MDKVYVETTIPSYITSKLSKDIITAARQQTSREWWNAARVKYDLYISEFVLEECRMGDLQAAKKRVALISDIKILKLTDDISKLAVEYIKLLSIPKKASLDAYHLAFATLYELDYLLTWNCAHMAQSKIIAQLRNYNRINNLFEPIILTPAILMWGG
ncbi:MAG: type II toxin-antitoxin system VapC family toxin [Sporomusaceae bacterium]|nr:type II toxin-antitoxin system VapC family toxin [Sporomusaceae bacterium]